MLFRSMNPEFETEQAIASVGGVIDDKQERDVRNFFKRNPLPGTERVIEQTLERVRIRSKFLRRIKVEFE